MCICIALFAHGVAMAEEDGAKIVFDKESYNFGEIARTGGDVQTEFVYKNSGTKPLVIKKVTKSCTCTTVEFSKRPIMPGKSGVITVVYAPDKLPAGTFHKAIKVFTNDEQGMHILTVHGESVE